MVLLNQGLTRLGYETHLVGGALRPGEDSMAYFAEQYGETPIQIPELVTDTSVGASRRMSGASPDQGHTGRAAPYRPHPYGESRLSGQGGGEACAHPRARTWE